MRKILPLRFQLFGMAGLRMAQAAYRRPRGNRNFIWSAISQMIGSERAYGYPVSITIEPANICNLRCPVCETGDGTLGRKPQMMNYGEFVKILDKVGPGANHLIFYFMGEPFVNPDAYRMVRYARDMGLYVTSCTNGEVIDPEKLYESGINQISFQIGGATQETHSIYRVNGNIRNVLDKVSKYVEIIQRRGRKDSENRVELGFIVMRHNEREVEQFFKMALSLGVDKGAIINPCVRTPQQARVLLPESDSYWIYDREKFEREGYLVPKRIYPDNLCPWLYDSITVQVNGDVVPCCRDPQGRRTVGNLLRQSLEEVWNGPRLRAFRREVLDRQREIDICRLCPGEGFATLFEE
jgi:radical SAM protein with 4Fe4S-binding SPASM domain